MEELTIEEKAERYDERLARAKDCLKDGTITSTAKSYIEEIFPELAESEDDKIRKAILEHIKGIKSWEYFLGISKEQMIDWLEKQGEQNPVEDVNGDDYGVDSLWHAQRILEKTLGKVDGYQSDDGILEHECAISAVKKLYEQNHAWSEEDEKMLNSCIGAVGIADYYTLDDKQEIEVFLKSLKFRLLSPLIREFDKEEGNVIDHLIAICDDAMCYDTFAGCSKKDIEKYKTFLTNLKFGINPQPQNTWKPSDEQIEALEHFVRNIAESGFASPYDSNTKLVCSLFNDLKKLREE